MIGNALAAVDGGDLDDDGFEDDLEENQDEATRPVEFVSEIEIPLIVPVEYGPKGDEEIVTRVTVHDLSEAQWDRGGTPYKIDADGNMIPNVKSWKRLIPMALKRPKGFCQRLSQPDRNQIGTILIGFFTSGVPADILD